MKLLLIALGGVAAFTLLGLYLLLAEEWIKRWESFRDQYLGNGNTTGNFPKRKTARKTGRANPKG